MNGQSRDERRESRRRRHGSACLWGGGKTTIPTGHCRLGGASPPGKKINRTDRLERSRGCPAIDRLDRSESVTGLSMLSQDHFLTIIGRPEDAGGISAELCQCCLHI